MDKQFRLDEFRVRENYPCSSGGNGEVWDAWHHHTYERVAIKMLGLPISHNDFMNEVKRMQEACSELSAVPMHGYISTHVDSLPYKGIVSKFMPCGSLDDVIHKFEVPIPKCLAYRILTEISAAMHKLHNISGDQRLLHLDLKPSNIMLDSDLHAQLSDFGAAAVCSVTGDRDGNRQRDSGMHSLCYVDPLFLRDGAERTSGSDVYSFAIMMWETLAGRRPYPDMPRQTFKDVVITGTRPSMDFISPEFHSAEIRGLMQRGWDLSLRLRPSFADIRNTLRSHRFTEQELTNAVSDVKQAILQRLNADSFDVNGDEYNISFLQALRVPPESRAAQPIRNPAQNQPAPGILDAPSGDRHPNTVDDGQPRLTDADCLRLGRNLHYTDGWQALGGRIGISSAILENIREDNRNRAVDRKVEIFREWMNANGGSNALVRDLIRALRRAKVAIDCWEFLDPNREIRRSLGS